MNKEFYNNFPCVLKYALENDIVAFPIDAKKRYEKRTVFRVIRREDDDWKVRESDFLSQMELINKGYRYRPMPDKNNINAYSCSFFTNKRTLINIMHLPKGNKKIIFGDIHQSYGIMNFDKRTSHINLWLYINGRSEIVKEFEVIDDERQTLLCDKRL